jgi:hypothetical protein
MSVQDLQGLSAGICVMSIWDNLATVPRTPSQKVARAFLSRGTKVVLWRQYDFNSLNNDVFFEGWAGQECPGYLFVHGGIPACPARHPVASYQDQPGWLPCRETVISRRDRRTLRSRR